MDTSDKSHIVNHNDEPTVGDEVGEAAGGISGVVAGAAIGSAVGPLGTVIGGIAGAIGGWWAGRAVSEAAKHYTNEDDAFYRHKYETSPTQLGDTSYEQIRPAYQIGHLAGRNPDYTGKSFETVETDLRRGWDNGANTVGRDWDKVKDYAKDAYTRSSSALQNAAHNTTASTQRAATDAGATLDEIGSSTPDRADDVYNAVNPTRTPITPEGPDASSPR